MTEPFLVKRYPRFPQYFSVQLFRIDLYLPGFELKECIEEEQKAIANMDDDEIGSIQQVAIKTAGAAIPFLSLVQFKEVHATLTKFMEKLIVNRGKSTF